MASVQAENSQQIVSTDDIAIVIPQYCQYYDEGLFNKNFNISKLKEMCTPEYVKILETDMNNTHNLHNLGTIASLVQDNQEKSLEYLSKSVKMGDINSCHMYGCVLMRTKNYTLAREMFEKSITAGIGTGGTYNSLGTILMKFGEYTLALEKLTIAKEMGNEYATNNIVNCLEKIMSDKTDRIEINKIRDQIYSLYIETYEKTKDQNFIRLLMRKIMSETKTITKSSDGKFLRVDFKYEESRKAFEWIIKKRDEGDEAAKHVLAIINAYVSCKSCEKNNPVST